MSDDDDDDDIHSCFPPSIFSNVFSYRLTVTQNVSLVEQELLSFPISIVGFVLVNLYFSVCHFLCCSTCSFGHCIVFPSSNCSFTLHCLVSSNVYAAAHFEQQIVVISRWRPTATWWKSNKHNNCLKSNLCYPLWFVVCKPMNWNSANLIKKGGTTIIALQNNNYGSYC